MQSFGIFFSLGASACIARTPTYIFIFSSANKVQSQRKSNENHKHSHYTNIDSLCSFDMVYYLKLKSFFLSLSSNWIKKQHNKNSPTTNVNTIAYASYLWFILYYSVAYHLSCRCAQCSMLMFFFMILSLQCARVRFYDRYYRVDSVVCLVNFILSPSIFSVRLSSTFCLERTKHNGHL